LKNLFAWHSALSGLVVHDGEYVEAVTCSPRKVFSKKLVKVVGSADRSPLSDG
jgi:hypothetical protein